MKFSRKKVETQLVVIVDQRVCARKEHGSEVFQILGRFRIQHGAQSRITDDVLCLLVMMDERSSFSFSFLLRLSLAHHRSPQNIQSNNLPTTPNKHLQKSQSLSIARPFLDELQQALACQERHLRCILRVFHHPRRPSRRAQLFSVSIIAHKTLIWSPPEMHFMPWRQPFLC